MAFLSSHWAEILVILVSVLKLVEEVTGNGAVKIILDFLSSLEDKSGSSGPQAPPK